MTPFYSKTLSRICDLWVVILNTSFLWQCSYVDLLGHLEHQVSASFCLNGRLRITWHEEKLGVSGQVPAAKITGLRWGCSQRFRCLRSPEVWRVTSLAGSSAEDMIAGDSALWSTRVMDAPLNCKISLRCLPVKMDGLGVICLRANYGREFQM